VYCVKSKSYLLYDVELIVYAPLKLIVNSEFLGIFKPFLLPLTFNEDKHVVVFLIKYYYLG